MSIKSNILNWAVNSEEAIFSAQKLITNKLSMIRQKASVKFINRTYNNHEVIIKGGPFKGMKYIFPLQIDTVYIPKLLGSFESELHPFIEEVCLKNYKKIINIGTAEGYYAAGLAVRNPDTEIFGFEENERMKNLFLKTALINNVADRLNIKGKCSSNNLSKLLSSVKSGFIICDCEGCEFDLLNPEKIKELKNFDFIIEIHELNRHNPTAFQIMQSRFYRTHNIININVQKRNPENYKLLDSFTELEKKALLNEGRFNCVGWMYLLKK
jgi:hypothetical protein